MNVNDILEKWVLEARDSAEGMDVGLNISTRKAVKIAFDGYGETDEGEEDLDMESYAVYIHKDALGDNFEFPEHSETAWAVVQRPEEEVCHHLWFNVTSDVFEGPDLSEAVEGTSLTIDQVTAIVTALDI